MLEMDLKEKMKSAVYAGIAGDALGVPVESSTRQQLALCSALAKTPQTLVAV